MNKQLLIYFGIAVVVVGAAVFIAVSGNKGSHLRLDGKILKVRTGPLGDGNSVAVLDFRVTNPSDVPFIVETVDISLEKKNGEMVDGVTIAKTDLKQLFAYNRFLGDEYNDGLTIKDSIAPHATVDRMVAAHFEVGDRDLDAAKAIHLTLTDVDGPMWETTRNLP